MKAFGRTLLAVSVILMLLGTTASAQTARNEYSSSGFRSTMKAQARRSDPRPASFEPAFRAPGVMIGGTGRQPLDSWVGRAGLVSTYSIPGNSGFPDEFVSFWTICLNLLLWTR